MRVARAEEGDLPQVTERWKEMMLLHRDLDPAFTMAEDGMQVFQDYLRTCLSSEDHLLLVAKEEGEVLGYLLAHIMLRPPVFKERAYGEISDLAVRKDHWRKGAGGRMLKAAMKWFEGKGVRRIEVRASPGNPIAKDFWRKHGFVDHFHVMSIKNE